MTRLPEGVHRFLAEVAESEHRMAVCDALIGTAHVIASALPMQPRDTARWAWWTLGAAKDAVGWKAIQAWHEWRAR